MARAAPTKQDLFTNSLQIKFQKGIDKSKDLWYNIGTVKEMTNL